MFINSSFNFIFLHIKYLKFCGISYQWTDQKKRANSNIEHDPEIVSISAGLVITMNVVLNKRIVELLGKYMYAYIYDI